MTKNQLQTIIKLVIDRNKNYKDSLYGYGSYEISGTNLVKFEKDLTETLYEFIGTEVKENENL